MTDPTAPAPSVNDDAALIDLLTAQNIAIDFPSFSHDDAFALGCDIVRRATEAGLAIATSIVFGEQRVFHAALAGTSADNDDWMARKARVVARFNEPSLLFAMRLKAMGVELAQLTHLDARVYADAGGGFPLRVNGSLIGAVVVSGLPQRDDHDLVVAALEAALASRR